MVKIINSLALLSIPRRHGMAEDVVRASVVLCVGVLQGKMCYFVMRTVMKKKRMDLEVNRQEAGSGGLR